MSAEDARFRTVPAGVLRLLAFAAFVTGIVGMIVASIDDDDGLAVTFGLIAAVAALCLIAATAVGAFDRRHRFGSATGELAAGVDAEALASRVEDQVAALIDAGADEDVVRELARRAVDLGRSFER